MQEMTEIIPGLQGDAPFLRKRVPFVGGKYGLFEKIMSFSSLFLPGWGTEVSHYVFVPNLLIFSSLKLMQYGILKLLVILFLR